MGFLCEFILFLDLLTYLWGADQDILSPEGLGLNPQIHHFLERPISFSFLSVSICKMGILIVSTA